MVQTDASAESLKCKTTDYGWQLIEIEETGAQPICCLSTDGYADSFASKSRFYVKRTIYSQPDT